MFLCDVYRSLAKAKTSALSEEGTSQQQKGQADMELITKPGMSVCLCVCVCLCLCVYVYAECYGMCVCKIHDHKNILTYSSIPCMYDELCYSVL